MALTTVTAVFHCGRDKRTDTIDTDLDTVQGRRLFEHWLIDTGHVGINGKGTHLKAERITMSLRSTGSASHGWRRYTVAGVTHPDFD